MKMNARKKMMRAIAMGVSLILMAETPSLYVQAGEQTTIDPMEITVSEQKDAEIVLAGSDRALDENLPESVSENKVQTDVFEESREDAPLEAEEVSILYSGKEGSVNWSIDSDWELLVNGTIGEDDYFSWYSVPWEDYIKQIQTATVSVSGLTSTMGMFYGYEKLTSVDLSNLDTSNVTSMESMFYGCSSLKNLDLSNFNTTNVTDMYEMFSGCSSLSSLNVSSFNTTNVTDMYGMFSGCSSLSSLNVSNFNTTNVTDMVHMFSGCSSLSSLNVSNFNTTNVTNMDYMFSGCSSLKNLDLSNFSTTKVTDMSDMFYDCSSLTGLNVSNFNTTNVTNMRNMFYGCSSLTGLNVSNFNTTNVTNMSDMFGGCSSLKNLDVSNFNTTNVTNLFGMFSGCSSLTGLNVGNFNTMNVTDMGYMFFGCSSLKNLDVSGFNTAAVTDMSAMFYGCDGLTTLDFSNFVLDSVTDMGSIVPDNDNGNLVKIVVPAKVQGTVYLYAYNGYVWVDQNGTICEALTQGLATPMTYERKKQILEYNTEIAAIDPQLYTGKAIKPEPKVTCDGVLLTKGIDYTVSYENNVDLGNATVVIKGKGGYIGSVKTMFRIYKTMTADNTTVTFAGPYNYIRDAVEPIPVVKCDGVTLKHNTDFDVIYENNYEPGTATATIKGKGKYSGSVQGTFTIELLLDVAKLDTVKYTFKKGNKNDLTSKTYYSLYVDFTPVKYAEKYEIELTDYKGKTKKTVTGTCAFQNFVKRNINNLTEDVYGVRMRGINGKIYGGWSDKTYVIKQPKSKARYYKGNVEIKWQKLKGVTGYEIYMGKKKNGPFKKVATAGKNATFKKISKYDKKKFSKGVYYYYVIATKKVGKQTFRSEKNGINKVTVK